MTVTPKDTVEIQGEVDKDWNSVEIDETDPQSKSVIVTAPGTRSRE